MQHRMGALYRALKAAGVSEDLAREAAEEAASAYLDRLRAEHGPQLRTRFPVLPTWVLGLLLAMNVLGAVGLAVRCARR